MGRALGYLGFGWKSIVGCLAFGLASYYYAAGWVHWVVYFLFAVMVAYMVTKFRLYKREPWRRVHAHGMSIFNKLAKHEAVEAHRENRRFDMVQLCGKLADNLVGPEAGSEFFNSYIVNDACRKAYYRHLVDTYPLVYTQKLEPEKHAEALDNILKDIEASELGPDIVIAAAIEKKYGPVETARYLLALATGVTAQNSLFV